MSVSYLARRAQAAFANPRMRKRLGVILTNSANSLLVPLFSPVAAVLVVRMAGGPGLWGDYVRVLVVAQLVSHIVGWGNKDYVLREFARTPAARAAAWQTSFFTRLALLAVAGAALALVGFGPARGLLVALLVGALTLAQAFEVFVLYRRDFAFALGVEALSVAVQAAPILALRSALTLEALLLAVGAATLVKAGMYAWRYRAEVGTRREGHLDLGWLRRAWPFFLLGLSGLLQSRVDLYAVTAWLPRDQIGRYQVYANLMIYLQSVAAFVLVPFVRSLYRLNDRALFALSLKLGLAGLVVVALGVPAAALALRYGYALDFAPAFWLAGALFVLPIYFYLPIIYALFKADKALWVVAANGVGLTLSLALSAWWLPRLGALGAAWASAATQWALLLLYGLWTRKAGRESHALPVPDLS